MAISTGQAPTRPHPPHVTVVSLVSWCLALLAPAVLALACRPAVAPAPSAAPTAPAPTPTAARSAEADAYLEAALDFIRANSVRAAQVNWPLLLHEVRWRAYSAQTPAETYPAIRQALQLLGDRHSSFYDPEQARQRREGIALGTGLLLADRVIAEVIPGGPAAEAGLLAGDMIQAINGTPVGSTLTPVQRGQLYGGAPVLLQVSRKPAPTAAPLDATLRPASFAGNRPPAGRRLDGDLGYVDLPTLGCGAPEVCQPYADAVHEILAAIDHARPHPVCGWIVDLRRNGGGNMYPMISGIGPVLGEGPAGALVHPGAEPVRWGYRTGAAFNGAVDVIRARQPYALAHPDPPVAILTSAFTASSGEFVLLSFRGRPHTRTFGQPTAGLPTANQGKVLPDGALISLTTALGADRTGTTYDSAIAPDEPIALDWTLIESPDDPVVAAAAAWLRAQGCG